MTPKEFIISSLNDITDLFDNVQCKYRYDSYSEGHYIEIVPAKIFKDSKQLKNYRGQILDKFYSYFPLESIVFLTEGSKIKMDNFEYLSTGLGFVDPFQKTWMHFAKPFITPCDDYLSFDVAGDNNYALAA